VTDKPLRAALYARVSTLNGQDVGLQLDELRQVAGQRGWRIVDEYIDEGHSGSTENRPALDRLMADGRGGRVDLVAVFRFDRFARSTRHLLVALEEFRVLGVHFDFRIWEAFRHSVKTVPSAGPVFPYQVMPGPARTSGPDARQRTVNA